MEHDALMDFAIEVFKRLKNTYKTRDEQRQAIKYLCSRLYGYLYEWTEERYWECFIKNYEKRK